MNSTDLNMAATLFFRYHGEIRGPDNAGVRQKIMECLGEKLPKSACGAVRVEAALWDQLCGATGMICTCLADRDRKIWEACMAITRGDINK